MTRPPLELLLEGWETRARRLNENSRTEEDAQLSWYYGGRAAELADCIKALRAQAEANADAGAENAVLRDFLSAFADEDGCGCGYSSELLTAYRAAYDLVWPEPAQADAGGEG